MTADPTGAGRPRVLVFAYAGEPGRGSEPGAGWGIIRAVADFAECTVLTAPEHTRGIQRWMQAEGHPWLTFHEVPEPRGAALAKYHRVSWFVLYLLWLRRARKLARRLHQERPFTLFHHATYSIYWLPTPAVDFDVPCVWGPVGGAVTTPLKLWPALGWRGLPGELLDRAAVALLSRLPSTRRTWRRATVRLVQNQETLARLPGELRADTRVLNHALFTDAPPKAAEGDGGDCLFVGALESRKGCELALRAVRQADARVRLRVLGDGPDRHFLRRLTRRWALDSRVRFDGNVPRDQALAAIAGASAVVFTGLREEGGIALSEAMLYGCPVIVLDNGGAATLARSAVDPSRVALIPVGSVEETARLIGEAMTRFTLHPPERRGPNLDQPRAKVELKRAFLDALATRTA